MRSIVWLPVACLLACNVSPNETAADAGAGDTAPPATDAGPPDNPPPPALFTLQVQIVGQGSIASSPAGIGCASSCSAQFAAGSVVLLTATPAAGQDFLGWSGPCGGTGTCTVTLGSDTVAIANFAAQAPPPVVKARHVLTVAIAGQGSGTVSSAPDGISCGTTCAATFDDGTVVLLTASPAARSHFAGWLGACSGAGPCTITLSADMAVSAFFEPDPLPLACAGIAPASSVPMRQHAFGPSTITGLNCLDGLGDANGLLGFPIAFPPGVATNSVMDLVFESGVFDQRAVPPSIAPRPVQQIDGVSLWGDPGLGDSTPNKWFVSTVESSGQTVSVPLFGKNLSGAADSSSGVLLAGDLGLSPVPESFLHAAIMFNGDGQAPSVRWGPSALASHGAVFGTGVDRFGRSIIITDGSLAFGPHTISAQILETDGQALTGEFLVISGFSPGNHTWFETSALIGGGWVVRRMDQDLNGAIHAHALATIPSNGRSVSAAPSWMTSRPDTKLVVVRGGAAYAAVPYGANNVSCTQQVELLAPDGTLCSVSTYPIAAGTCDTRDLTLSEDGTVIQLLPDSMEPPPSTCTWRWWARTLR